MIKYLDMLRERLLGFRKVLVSLLALLVPAALLVMGYDVSKMGWLAGPLSAFMGANLIEHMPKFLEKMIEMKNQSKE